MSVQAELVDELRGFDATQPPDVTKHDRVMTLIAVCIDEGCCGGSDIVQAIKALGYDPQHIGMMLKEGRGDWWTRDAKGRYTNLQHTT